MTLIDTTSYEKLVPEFTYVLGGYLMNKLRDDTKRFRRIKDKDGNYRFAGKNIKKLHISAAPKYAKFSSPARWMESCIFSSHLPMPNCLTILFLI